MTTSSHARLSSRRAHALKPSIIRQMSQRRRASSIDLTLGQPCLPPDAQILEAAQRRLHDEGHGYTQNAGLPELRALVAEHHGLPQRGGPEHVVMTVGSEQGVYMALMACIDPGHEVLVPEPGYPAYRGIVELLGGVAVPYHPERDTGLVARAEALEPLITERTRAVVLNDPNNPFGTVLPSDELDRLAELVERHKLVAVCDEIYRDLRYDGQLHDSLAARTARAVLVGGLSKSCALTGHRLGYVIADEQTAAAMTLMNQLMVTCAPRPAQYVGLQVFLTPGALRAHVPHYEASREAVRQAGAALGPKNPMHLGQGAFYAVIDVQHQAQGDSLGLAMRLLEDKDVVVVPGVAFGPSGEWFWRLSYAGGPDELQLGLRRIADFLNTVG